MAEFRTRRIRHKPPFKPLKKIKERLIKCSQALSNITKKQKSYFLGSILIFIAVLIVFKVTTGIYVAVQNFEPRDMVFALGTDLKQDENGYTNIILLGDGGHVRDGADLVDTIMVASIDFDGKTISLMSIPRDFYVWSDKYGDSKINELYRNNKNEYGKEDAYVLYQEVAGDIVDLDIQYYLRVDFGAFVEVIDDMGGVMIDVKEAIYDPYYPNNTDNGYTVFEVDTGLQEMNGETALKFVRSRKTTSDFDRAARQQQMLMAIKDAALSGNVLTNPSKIKKLYQAISGNINTNMELRELLALASFGKDFDRKNMVMKVLHDDPSRDGGFLYTPERKYYNGQFVLVADGTNYDMIHKYADLIFHKRDVLMHPIKIEILNATKKAGIARNVASYLTRYGFNITNIDNLLDDNGKKKYVDRSFVRYNNWEVDMEGVVKTNHQETLDALVEFINGEAIPSDELATENQDVDISIVLGADHKIL